MCSGRAQVVVEGLKGMKHAGICPRFCFAMNVPCPNARVGCKNDARTACGREEGEFFSLALACTSKRWLLQQCRRKKCKDCLLNTPSQKLLLVMMQACPKHTTQPLNSTTAPQFRYGTGRDCSPTNAHQCARASACMACMHLHPGTKRRRQSQRPQGAIVAAQQQA